MVCVWPAVLDLEAGVRGMELRLGVIGRGLAELNADAVGAATQMRVPVFAAGLAEPVVVEDKPFFEAAGERKAPGRAVCAIEVGLFVTRHRRARAEGVLALTLDEQHACPADLDGLRAAETLAC